MTRYILFVLFSLNSIALLLALKLSRSSILSINRKESGDIVSFSDSCKAKPAICNLSRATCRHIDGTCVCPKSSTFYNSKCHKQISDECRYFMDNALKPNETHVPAIKLNEVNAFKQIGGLLKYVTQEKEKKIHVFRSCAVDASLFWEWSTGEWALLDKKDFAVESVGNSNYMVLRWNGAAPNYAYQGHLVKLRLSCDALEGRKYKNCLVFKVPGNATDPKMKTTAILKFIKDENDRDIGVLQQRRWTTLPLISTSSTSLSVTKTNSESTKHENVKIDKQLFIIVASGVAVVVALAVLKSLISCCKFLKRCSGSSGKPSATSATESEEEIELNVVESNCRTQSSNSENTNSNANIETANSDIEGVQNGSTTKERKGRLSSHIYCSIRSRIRSVFRLRSTTSSSNNSNGSYDYPEIRNGFPKSSKKGGLCTNDDIVHKEVARTVSNDSEGYVKMTPSELPTIMEAENYEPPVVDVDERHSYLHLEDDKNDNCVAKLVSQFNESMEEKDGQISPSNLQAKSMETVCFPEESRKNPFPKLQAKSMEVLNSTHNVSSKSPKPKIPQRPDKNLYKSLKGIADSEEVEEYVPLNPKNFTPMYQPLNERAMTRPDSYFPLDKETLKPREQQVA